VLRSQGEELEESLEFWSVVEPWVATPKGGAKEPRALPPKAKRSHVEEGQGGSAARSEESEPLASLALGLTLKLAIPADQEGGLGVEIETQRGSSLG